MTGTTHQNFGAKTEGVEVVKAFADRVHGKTILITGVNRGGLGFSAAQALASQSPACLVLGGRNPSKLNECIDALKAEFPSADYRPLKVDLSSQQSVRSAADDVLAWSDIPEIDIVINSAGIMLLPERTINDEGIEMHFATNHIGHFLLTCLIMPKLIKAAQRSPKGAVRIVNVSSASPMFARMRWSDMNFEKLNKDLPESEQPNYDALSRWGYKDAPNMSYVPLEGYNQSKVANVLFSIAATKRLYERYGILSLAVHPGVISTELGRNAASETLEMVGEMMKKGLFTRKTLGGGSSTALVAALDPKLGPGEQIGDNENFGAYLDDCQITDKAQPQAVSSTGAERLWQVSEELVKEKFSW